MKLPRVTSVIAVADYKLRVAFDDGMEGVYDAGHLAGKGVFKSWQEGNLFQRVFIDPASGAISWPGELDIDILTVYCNIKGVESDALLQGQTFHAADF